MLSGEPITTTEIINYVTENGTKPKSEAGGKYSANQRANTSDEGICRQNRSNEQPGEAPATGSGQKNEVAQSILESYTQDDIDARQQQIFDIQKSRI